MKVKTFIEQLGGSVEEVHSLPDGSGFATATFELPKDHWIYAEKDNVPPMPMKVGTDDARRPELEEQVSAAARYAIRGATMNGKEMDFDPDALVQNMIVGLLGYYTPDGTLPE